MQGIICYYSASGNTRLVCQAIAQRVPSLAFDLYDITQGVGHYAKPLEEFKRKLGV